MIYLSFAAFFWMYTQHSSLGVLHPQSATSVLWQKYNMKMDFHPSKISELAKWYTHYCKYCPKNVVVISDVARGLDPWGQAGSLRTTHTTTGQDTHPRTGRREQVEKSKEGRIMVSRGIAGMSFQDNAVEASISVRLWAVEIWTRSAKCLPLPMPSQFPLQELRNL